ncbi:MAG TPA: AAA family ATPase, partial [Solirubrobacteraceae bacterium]
MVHRSRTGLGGRLGLAGRIQLRRRGRGSGRQGLLVERDSELAALEQRLADACDGAGSVVVIEGPAGKGKSRLLTIAGDLAREAGAQVLGAHGSELERDFPFGVAIQLFEP